MKDDKKVIQDEQLNNNPDENKSSDVNKNSDENRKSLWNRVYISMFLVIILIPFVCMTFYKTDMSLEKRTGAPFPKLKTYDGKLNLDYFDNLNDYFNDHFAFRQEMTTLDAMLTTGLTKTSVNDDVIYGKDGWLFYTETMDEYFGRNVLSDRGINNTVISLKLMQEYSENNDAEFLFMVCPIKADLYPENLPYNYKKGSEVNNWTKLQPAMDREGIKYVNLHEPFMNDERVMYHKLDTHWNNEGASFACKLIQNSIGRDAYDYTNEPCDYKKSFRGDLYGMLYPKGSELDYNQSYSHEHEFKYITATKSTEDFNIQTSTEGKDGSLLMFRDSYGNALIPYMADEYKDAYFTKIMPFDLGLISEYNADVVMVELTQRHITYLWEYLPVMDAPLRDDVTDTPEETEESAVIKVDKTPDGKLVVYGTADPDYTDDVSHIYIRITDSEYISDYEAFPVGYRSTASGTTQGSNEEGLSDKFSSGDYNEKDYQFGMYISPEDIAKGECTFELITEKDGVFYTTGNIYSYINE